MWGFGEILSALHCLKAFLSGLSFQCHQRRGGSVYCGAKIYSILVGQITVGTLILQDCTIGLLFALLPILGGSHGILEGTVSLLRTATATIIFACAISICRTHVHAIFDLVSNSKHCRELHQMVRHSTIPVSPNVLFLSNIWQERM